MNDNTCLSKLFIFDYISLFSDIRDILYSSNNVSYKLMFFQYEINFKYKMNT